MDSVREHREQAAREGPIAIAVVTVSDSRTKETDRGGSYLCREVERRGHRLAGYSLIPDEAAALEGILAEIANGPADVAIFSGGTGIAQRDRTIDVLGVRLEKTLPGFGELFRMLSYEEIGSAAILSRAVAGLYRGKFVFCLPGSPAAVRLAWEKLIEPELRHLVWERRR
jgi:molybdopterin adenylyltransferase